LIGLCEALERFPEHPEAPVWRQAIRLYADNYLTPVVGRSAFGIAPFSLYSKDPGGNRHIGDYWYRYFMELGPRWWVGINANLASTGVGLAKAARLLKEPRLAALAQRQLDWIVGVNPFDASTMTGVGRNQPKQFVTGEFKPVTPLIDGAVMNGIGGTPDDQPDLKAGSWQTCEYWTPMVCYTMWLMSELSAQ
jgi:Glycosyl hydrolase family 9